MDIYTHFNHFDLGKHYKKPNWQQKRDVFKGYMYFATALEDEPTHCRPGPEMIIQLKLENV